jgi:hypothetical protein
MDEQLRESHQSAEQLLARAAELRAQAEQSHLKGLHDASLALADRYEQAASIHVQGTSARATNAVE